MNNKIIYLDHTFTDADIRSGNPSYARDLLSASLEIDTFEFEALSSDTTLTQFVRNTPLTYYHDDVQMGIFYVQKISRTTVCTYRFECTSTIGLLDESYHNGGIYTGETVKEVVEDICGPFPVWIKTNIQNIQLYGWLPIATRRENLSQVLFAIGATLKVDYNGTLRVEGLWDGQSTEIDAGHMHAGGSVEYSTPVTQVIVTEHAYTANATEVAELFNGTTATGDKITFDEPCYDLTAEGFSILEAAANYAIVSAGSGTLTGKKYVHTTRQIVKDVQPAARELVSQSDNIATVENATLVSLVNANAVADRLVRYYACTERIVNKMVTQRESPGDVVSVYHPYEDAAVQGCIESSDVTVSGKLASTESILVGYRPQMPEDIVTYNHRELLSGSGAWTVPAGVTSLRVILIGGGKRGTQGDSGESVMVSSRSWPNSKSFSSPDASAGKGGEGGQGGSGGNILDFTLDVTPGMIISFSAGLGETEEISATDSVFGSETSQNGSPSENGWTDITTGEIFGMPGKNGVKGGDGGAEGESGENVGDFIGGSPSRADTGILRYSGINVGTFTSRSSGGGGAAYGNNGRSAYDGSAHTGSGEVSGGVVEKVGIVISNGGGGGGANGGNGADGAAYGAGGDGGNGGGGAGACAGVSVSVTNAEKCSGRYNGTSTSGGRGGIGGNGADGCIIVFYGIQRIIPHGAFQTSDGKWMFERQKRRLIV